MEREIEDVSPQLRKYLYRLADVLGDQKLRDVADLISTLELRLLDAEIALEFKEAPMIPPTRSELIEKFHSPRQVRLPTKPVPLDQRAGPLARQLMQEATHRPRERRHLALQSLGDTSLLAFFILVEEAEEWGGEPCIGTSGAPGLRGALPHLKRAGLLTTYSKQDGSQRGSGTYARFTDLAKEILNQLEAGA